MKRVRRKLRPLIGLIAAILLAGYLHSIAWPWWIWAPAAALGGMAAYMAQVLGWFLWRKLTYEAFARRLKARNRRIGPAN